MSEEERENETEAWKDEVARNEASRLAGAVHNCKEADCQVSKGKRIRNPRRGELNTASELPLLP